jgi:hypothetical protein
MYSIHPLNSDKLSVLKYNICPKDRYYEKSNNKFRQSIALIPLK